MTSTLACPNNHRAECCWLLAPLAWPAHDPTPRHLHRLLASLANLLDAVGAAHRLATEFAALADPPAQGWAAALKTVDVAAVDATDTAALTRQLTDHDLDEAAEHLRRGLEHRLQVLQLLRRAVAADRLAPLDRRQVAGLLAAVVDRLDQAGRLLAAADDTVTTAAWKARP